jgi:hypothetical protein
MKKFTITYEVFDWYCPIAKECGYGYPDDYLKSELPKHIDKIRECCSYDETNDEIIDKLIADAEEEFYEREKHKARCEYEKESEEESKNKESEEEEVEEEESDRKPLWDVYWGDKNHKIRVFFEDWS